MSLLTIVAGNSRFFMEYLISLQRPIIMCKLMQGSHFKRLIDLVNPSAILLIQLKTDKRRHKGSQWPDLKHSSKLCKNYWGKKQSAGILSIIEWPAQSPDRNTIELLGEQLNCMYQTNPTWRRCLRKDVLKGYQITSINWQLECQRSARL